MDLTKRIQRCQAFLEDKRPGQVLLCINYTPDKWSVGTARAGMDLREYDFSSMDEHRRFWDAAARHILADLEAHEGIEDEWVPVVEPFYGYGSFAAPFSDCELTFTVDTSYSTHPLGSLDDLGSLSLNADRFWRRVFRECAGYLSEQSQGRFFINPFPQPSPLDLANLLRGNEIFTDLALEPEKSCQLLGLCTDAINRYVAELQGLIAPGLPGRACFGRWYPGGPLLLEDAGDMISCDMFRDFVAPHTGNVLKTAGGGYLHHHSLGRHQYRNVASLNALSVQQISSDPNERRPARELDYVIAQAGHNVVDLEVSFDEVRANIDRFKQGRFILGLNVDNKEEAEAIVAFVRRHYPAA